MIELQPFVLGTRRSPVKQVDIVALLDHILDEAIAWPQIEDIRPVHQREHQQQWYLVPLLGGDDWNVAVQPGFVERPDHLLWRLGNAGAAGAYPQPSTGLLLNPPQFALQRSCDPV